MNMQKQQQQQNLQDCSMKTQLWQHFKNMNDFFERAMRLAAGCPVVHSCMETSYQWWRQTEWEAGGSGRGMDAGGTPANPHH